MGLRTSRIADRRSDADKAVYSLRNTLVLPELKGETLRPEKLSEAEGKELRGFIKRKRAHGDSGVEPLDAKEERRFEKLAGKAAGDARLFARKHKERETQEKIAAAKEELRIAALPRRLEYAEPGSIALPRHVVNWLLNPAAGSLDLPILGALVGLLFSFENQKPILSGSVFEKRDEEVVLVCREPFDQLRFIRTVNPNDGSDDFRTSGRVKAQPALRYLIQNNWLAARQEAAISRSAWASGRGRCAKGRRTRSRRPRDRGSLAGRENTQSLAYFGPSSQAGRCGVRCPVPSGVDLANSTAHG